jgi:uncharacterized protein
MMLAKFVGCAGLALLIGVVAACGTTAPDRFYFLGLPASKDLSAPGPVSDFAAAVVLKLAGVPDNVDRPQLVVETGANELALLENDRWAEPLMSGIARTLSISLARALPKSTITADGNATAPGAMRIIVRIDALRLTYDGKAIVEATWTVTVPDAGAVTPHRTQVVRAVAARVPAELVKLWSEELDDVARQIARSLGA